MAEATSDDVYTVLESLLRSAEQLLLDKSFGQVAARQLLTSVWELYDRAIDDGECEEDLKSKVTARACAISQHFLEAVAQEREVYNPVQLRLFLCWALAAFPSLLTVHLCDSEELPFFYCVRGTEKEPNLAAKLSDLVERVLTYCFLMSPWDVNRLENLEALLDFAIWMERKRPVVTLFFVYRIGEIFKACGGLSARMLGRDLDVFSLYSYKAGIQWCSCLLRLGFLEPAKRSFSVLPEIKRSKMTSEMKRLHCFVHAQLLYNDGEHKQALEKAHHALHQSQQGEEESREIEELVDRISPYIDDDQKDTGPDEEWLEGTNVHQTQKNATRQKDFQRRHVPKPKHRRPKRVQRTDTEKETTSKIPEKITCQSVSQGEKSKKLPSSSPVTNWLQNISCTFRAASIPSSTMWNKNPSVPTTKAGSREINFSEGPESDEDDPDDENPFLEHPCFDFSHSGLTSGGEVTADEDWQDSIEESTQVLLPETGDEIGEDWYQRSVRRSAESHQSSLYISEQQVMELEQPGKRECRYVELEHDESKLNKLMKDFPDRYKQCQLNVRSSHHAVAKVLGKHDSCSEIQIDGRSRIGRTFMDDEVVVEILAAPGKREQLDDAMASVDSHTHGKVMGLLKVNRFAEVKHPELYCTLDEHETHLMWPLCKTVPKIHVLHDTRDKEFSGEAKNYVEIYQVSSEGCLEHRKFFRLDRSKLQQYVFRVVYITWRSNKSIYPLGAVLGVHFAGRDYTGGLELLALQHRLPTLYPPDAVAQTKELLQAEGPSLEGREDLRGRRVFTIDPEDATDLDDAISFWKEGTHFVVGVHITDVASIVPQGQGVDEEAKRRGFSFYPPLHKPHTMLPEELGNSRCSLLPGQDRLAFSVFFRFNQKGTQIGDPEIKRTLIKSCQQLTYTEVQKILDGKQCGHISKELHGDIHQLHRITSTLKESRRKHSIFFIPFEDPRLVHLQASADCIQARSLIEELMILTNASVAKRLRSKFPKEMLLRCHKAPSTDELTKWTEREGSLISNLVMRLQGNQVTHNKRLSLDNVESGNQTRKTDIPVMTHVWKRLHRLLEDSKIPEARRLAFTDDIHPAQHLAACHWMEMMEKAEYKCAYGLNGPDHRHFDLQREVYTHFTSPMRRYADLHVQRLLHNDLDGKPAYCSTEDVAELCRQLNSANIRQKAFDKECLALNRADSLQEQPLVFRAVVDTVDTEKMTVSVPSLMGTPDGKSEIPFSLLGVCCQPDFSTDTALQQDSVALVWSGRHFDTRGTCHGDLIPVWKHIERSMKSDSKAVEMTINPDQLTVPVNQRDWLRTVKALASKDKKAVISVPEGRKKNKAEMEVDYVSSEKGDGTVCLRSVRCKRVFKPTQVLQLQLSAEPRKGALSLCPELLHLAQNVSICTKHRRNPVQALTYPATRTTREQNFTSNSDYLQAWMPLLEMEAADSARDTDSTVTIDHVNVTMTTEREGYFYLPAKFCTDRCISIGGKSPDSIRAEVTKSRVLFPIDYLCLRQRNDCPARLVSQVNKSLMREAVDRQFTWLAHASVLAVTHIGRKSEDGGHLKVRFALSHTSPKPPEQLMSKDGAELTVEVLTKCDGERRAQEMLLQLEEDGCELARSLAYGTDIPDLDEDHYLLGQESENNEVPTETLPWNNKGQRKAIEQALTSSLSLIQGPPGTGKTITGVKLIYLFTQINQLKEEGGGKKSVLVCGPSNKSVDLVAKLMRDRLGKDCPSMVRVYSSAIEMRDYPVPRGDLRSRRGMQDLYCDQGLKEISLHHLIREDGKMYAEEIAQMEKSFAQSLQHPEMHPVSSAQLKRYRSLLFKACVEELKDYEVIFTTCAGAGSQRLIEGTRGKVFQVIIDESAMCSEPQAMIPIVASQAKQVVLIGDHKQLRPVITCQAAADLGLDQSLFERLFHKFPCNTVFLDKQYRMHPQLCAFPSWEFYDGNLETALSRSWTEELLPFWPQNHDFDTCVDKVMGNEANQVIPHVFVDVRGAEETLTVTTDEGNERSKSNALEIKKVTEILGFLKERCNVSLNKVMVLTQYNAQRNALVDDVAKKCGDRSQHVFSRYDKSNIKVSTVVSSQGGEQDYVILSTVRSLPSYKIEAHPTPGWSRQNLGFITDRNQVNVALTRARKGLFIVGNAELLRCDPVWRDLLDMYASQGCVVTAEDFPPPPTHRSHHHR